MIVIDIETTGTNPDKHALVSIGAVDLEQPQRQFYSECRAWEGAHFDEKSLEINGFSQAELTDPSKESLEVCMRGFLTWIDEAAERTLAGHNVKFDMNFLEASLQRAGLPFPFAKRTVDTHSLAYMHLVKRGEEPPIDKEHHHTALDSDFLFSYVGLNIERKTHNALEDAKLTAETIQRLLYREGLLEEYRDYALPAYL